MDKRIYSGVTYQNNENNDADYQKRRRVISVVSFLILIALFVVLTMTVGNQLLQFVSDPEKFRAWIDGKGVWGRLAMIGLMTLQVVVAIIPGEVFEIGAGYAFGTWEGLLLCLAGAAVGSAIIYGFTKLFGVKMVEAFISREKINSLKFINTSKKLDLLIFILFFIPGTPKDLFTYFIGLTPMKLTTFLLISSVARIPSVITSTIGGAALGMQNYEFAIIVFVVTAVISGIGVLVYRYLSKRKEGKAQEEQASADGNEQKPVS